MPKVEQVVTPKSNKEQLTDLLSLLLPTDGEYVPVPVPDSLKDFNPFNCSLEQLTAYNEYMQLINAARENFSTTKENNAKIFNLVLSILENTDSLENVGNAVLEWVKTNVPAKVLPTNATKRARNTKGNKITFVGVCREGFAAGRTKAQILENLRANFSEKPESLLLSNLAWYATDEGYLYDENTDTYILK